MLAPLATDSRLALVFGASGYMGANLVPALQQAGWRVRACARNRTELEVREWKGVELVEADARLPSTLSAVLAGVEVAYYFVYSLAPDDEIDALDVEGAGNFARAAEAAGVRRIVHLCDLIPPSEQTERFVSRNELRKSLRSGRVPVTELRAVIIIGPGSAAYEVIRDLVYRLPVMVAPRWLQSKASPIALTNMLHYLVRLPEIPEAAGEVYDAGGPDYLTYEEMLRRFADVVGKSPRILRVPVLAPKLSSYWLGLVTAIPPRIAKALLHRLEHDVPAHDAAIRGLIPQKLLSFTEAVQAAREMEETNGVAARWTEGMPMYRAYRPDYAVYAKKASGKAIAHVSPRRVWEVVTTLGGNSGYFYLDQFWRLREMADWLFGGPGFTRGRRDPERVRVGDAIDYWTVLAVEPFRRLTLHFGLKAPGVGILEFEIEPLAAKTSRITVSAYWRPRGIAGILYWAAFVPFHLFIFRGMTNAIARRAEAIEGGGSSGQ